MLNKLKEIQKANKNNKIMGFVIDDILDQIEEDMTPFILDTINGGCIKGGVPSLLYYEDTKKFFIEHHEEILNLLNDYNKNNGQYPQIDELSTNNLSWWAYEETMKKIAKSLDMDY